MARTPKRPRKVCTPGSVAQKPDKNKRRGRPSKVTVKVGTKRKDNYRSKYLPVDMQKALEDVREKRLSIRAAAIKYGVPRTTIGDTIKERVGVKLGRPTELNEEEERIIRERLMLMAEWGFPLDSKSTRYLVKNYLDALGKTTRFEDNLPGEDWLECFLARHTELSKRRANLIKRSRAAVTREIITDWFENYKVVVDGVPPENIWNCDETNLSDNPGEI